MVTEMDRSPTEYRDLYDTHGNINLTGESAQNLLKDWKEPRGFDKIGFTRSLGGYFYNYFFAILGSVAVAALYIPLLPYFYPWPESKSMLGISGVLFATFNTIFDIPTRFSIQRFIGEYRIKDTKKMMEFIRFYTWYQMLSGLGLVTAFSVFTLYVYQSGDLVWAKWLMLISMMRQYPAVRNIFRHVIRGLQRFDYDAYNNFLNEGVITPITEFVFALIGRIAIGRIDSFGPLFGIAIGISIGIVLQDLGVTAASAVFIAKALKPLGYRLRDCFVPKISRDVMGKSLKFGFFVALPSLFGALLSPIITLWWYEYVPAYLTLIALSKLADQIANLIKQGGQINVTAGISEAINNGKKELTSYYISMIWKFLFFFMFVIGAITMSFIPFILEDLLIIFGANEYLLATVFIVPNLIASIFEEPNNLGEGLIMGANHPKFMAILKTSVTLVNIGILYISFHIIEVQRYPIIVMIWFIPLWNLVPNLVQLTIKWRYINRKIAPVRWKVFGWQTFIAPLFPSLAVVILAYLWSNFAFPWMYTAVGPIPASIASILFAFSCLMFVFFPLYAYFGGWDSNSLKVFKEAVKISGPSKYLLKPIVWLSELLVKKSLFHNRYPIDSQKAQTEAVELMQIRHIKDKITSPVRED